MPGRYLDRLHAEFDEIRNGIDSVVNRAADDERDVTDAEQTQIDRDHERANALQAAIAHYTDIEQTQTRVMNLRRAVPTAGQHTRTDVPPASDDAYDVCREFPSIGDYVATVHRALVNRNPDAIAAIERATAHQMLADNPGIVPRPILDPVINLMAASRPFINSITTRPLPAGKFDRPKISQHVAVGVQAVEKDLTVSQKMTINPLPVTAATYAGHLNVSRQDIKWSNPSILSLIYEDFAAVYASTTDDAACDAFATSVTNTGDIATVDGPGIFAGIYDAAATVLAATNQLPDTLWASPDVWGQLGGVTTGQGVPLFGTLSPGSVSGSPMGLRFVVDAHFAAGTFIMGASRFAEWYEDIDGLMTVGEPDVLGQLIGYAGYAAFLNTAPEAFTKFTVPPPVRSANRGNGGSVATRRPASDTNR
jgi:HK97 family phage major capsid protein